MQHPSNKTQSRWIDLWRHYMTLSEAMELAELNVYTRRARIGKVTLK